MTKAELQQQLNALLDDAERDAHATLAMIAQTRNALANGTATSTVNGVTAFASPGLSIRRTKRKHLADHIQDILRDSGRYMRQPEIRDVLISKRIPLNPNSPLTAISTALKRKEGQVFRRGTNFSWGLIDHSEDATTE